MPVFSLQRLEMCAFMVLLASAAAILAIALSVSSSVVLVALGVVLISACATLLYTRALRGRTEEVSRALAAFMRGELDARILGIRRLDSFGKLQHRLNNMLDIVDLAVRKDQSAIDTGNDEAYLNKIRSTGLSAALQPSPSVLEIPPTLNVAPLLAELSQLKEAVEQLQYLTRELARRAGQQTVEKADVAPPKRRAAINNQAAITVQELREAHEALQGSAALFERLAERAEILSLNIAIAAAHAEQDERLVGAVSSLRLLAEQSLAARDRFSTTVEHAVRIGEQASHLLLAANHAPASSSTQASDRPLLLEQLMQALTAADGLQAHVERIALDIEQYEKAA